MHDAIRQLELFPAAKRKKRPAAPCQAGSPTSRAAAEAARDKIGRREQLVLAIIRGTGERGATRDELTRATGWPIQSVCPVVSRLVNHGLVIEPGGTRITIAGKKAAVLVATAREESR